MGLDPLDFIGRLAALVPRPRVHLVTYHGVFAPAASYRALVVPEPGADLERCGHDDNGASDNEGADSTARPPPVKRRRRYSWSELMKRVFKIDVLVCTHCGGPRRVLDLLTDAAVIERILAHLGLPTEAPVVAQARAPPGGWLPYQ